MIDGINPCAFAVIVFFISFLSVYNYSKKQMLVIGSSYILAVFIAYILIGIGLANVIYAISFVRWLIHWFYVLLAVFCIVLGVLALRDFWLYSKTSRPDSQLLQLPKFLKKAINKVIGSNLRRRQESGYLVLVAASFLVGILVSVLESACTGQIYLPVLSIILRNYGMNLRALSMLILYNIMFIIPLILVFMIAMLGASSEKLNAFLKKHIAQIKLLMAFLFFIMAYLILSH